MHNNWDKYVYTTILCVNHMAYAMCLSSFSPVLTEMIVILNTSTEYITLFMTFISIGLLLGSILGFAVKYVNRQLYLTLFLAIIAIATTMTPYAPNTTVLYTCALCIGIVAGVLNCVVNVWLPEMWAENSAPILQIPGLTFGLGVILSPLIIKPYLTDTHGLIIAPHNPGLISNTSDVSIIHINANEEEMRSRIKRPFLILGAIQMIFPILLIVMFIIKRYNYNDFKANEKSFEPKKPIATKLFDRQRKHRLLALILLGSLTGTSSIIESTFNSLAITYFQYSSLQLTAAKATEAMTAYTIPYTVFKGVAVFVAIKVQSRYILASSYAVSIIGMVILLFVKQNVTLLIVANIIFGIGCAPILRTAFAYVNQYVTVTDFVGTVMMIFYASFNIGPPYILGHYMKGSPHVFIICVSLALAVSIALLAVLSVIVRRTERSEAKGDLTSP